MSACHPTKTRKKTPMSAEHKAALAKGREEGRIVRQYLEALESTKPPTRPQAHARIHPQAADHHRRPLPEADPLNRLHLVEEKQRLEAELAHTGDTVDLAALEKNFVKVARRTASARASPTRRGGPSA